MKTVITIDTAPEMVKWSDVPRGAICEFNGHLIVRVGKGDRGGAFVLRGARVEMTGGLFGEPFMSSHSVNVIGDLADATE